VVGDVLCYVGTFFLKDNFVETVKNFAIRKPSLSGGGAQRAGEVWWIFL